ncbi:hypothetical protein V495_07099 [Pseudogymnoascus sp. VKM F-4514 (FW-929)]|nr:hypothetical protein V490_01150 [Pseudogymnoascus sp. VKM F-3557]KFY37576.1 hypothetical protein V495_07099 [Pseudogymnoascus sp. VKM F-4514 (FW-929)]KFY56854.1 hypothetical protein V497_05930 [Pseudogymnoascus sp. VKM F-4516 (FW-969)]
MVIKGPTVGGNGGRTFDLWRDSKPVEQLDVWYGKGSGDFEKDIVLKGIKVRWAKDEQGNVEQGQVGSCPPKEEQSMLHTSFSAGNEPIYWMNIYGSAGRANSLRLATHDALTHDERGHFEVGGIGGDQCIQPVEWRNLHGFYGRAGEDIDQLGAVFND